MATEIAHWRFTVDDYHQMAESGILSEDDRVELIDGEILQMTPISGSHMNRVNDLNRLLVQRCGTDAIVSIQNPIRLGRYDEPQPDVVVLRPRRYGSDVPTADDVLLLIEVAVSSLGYDRGTKLPLYAAADIPEVWIIDVSGGSIERYTNPVSGKYQDLLRAGRGELIESTVLPDLRIEVDEVLGDAT